MKKLGIYSRKSKMTAKGDSIENQIEMCKAYARSHFANSELVFIEYEDEGYSGKNTTRPMFQQLMKDVEVGKLDCVICYRLDRISRSVSDFCNIVEKWNRKNVAFISITESFDTNTPIGRAMMSIAMVFAQLERESIAERVRDNMLLLSKTGRWLGGKTAYGFNSERREFVDEGGVRREYSVLVPDDNESYIVVNYIYKEYLASNTIVAVRRSLNEMGVRNRNGHRFTDTHIKFILKNPVYCRADKDAYDYFFTEKREMDAHFTRDDFDGSFGIMPYNRHKNDDGAFTSRDQEEWVVAIGAHEGLISGYEWALVQSILAKNKTRYTGWSHVRGSKNNYALLTGLLFCGKCGGKMTTQPQTTYKGNRTKSADTFFYNCSTRKNYGTNTCDCKGILGGNLDNAVRDEILNWRESGSMLNRQLTSLRDSAMIKKRVKESFDVIADKIALSEKKIVNLLDVLSSGVMTESSVITRVQSQIVEIENEIDDLRKQSETLEKEAGNDSYEGLSDKLEYLLESFAERLDGISIPEQRAILSTFIEKVIYDGEHVDIFLKGNKG